MIDRTLQPAIVWGIVFGAVTVGLPIAVRWLEPATVHALSIGSPPPPSPSRSRRE